MKATYKGMFSVSGGFSKENGDVQMCEKGKGLKISFAVRKVLIHRPQLQTGILKYPTIGIKGLEAGAWSSGELDAEKNKGHFPVLPTAMVIAKDVRIKADEFDSKVSETFSKLEAEASLSVVSCLKI